MSVIERDGRSWTIRTCPICGAHSSVPEDYVCTCVCALEAVEVVPASNLRGAVEDLRYALRCAEAGESWLGTAQAIRGALRTLGVDPASPGGQ